MTDQIREFIAQDNLSGALEALKKNAEECDNEQLLNATIALIARLRELEESGARGELAREAMTVERNQLRNSILFLCQKPDAHLGDVSKRADTGGPYAASTEDLSKNRLPVALLITSAISLFFSGGYSLMVDCPTSFQSFIVRLFVALGVAGFGSMLCLYLLGARRQLLAGLVFLTMFLLVYTVNPAQLTEGTGCGPFSFTTVLTSKDRELQYDAARVGVITLQLDGELKKGRINPDGQVDFKGIPESFRNTQVNITLEHKGWRFAATQSNHLTIRLEGDYLNLALEADSSLESLFGQVMDASGKPVSNAQLSIKGGQVNTTSDSSGSFLLEIPLQWQAEEQSLMIRKEGYQYWNKTVYPGLQTEIPAILQKVNQD